MSGEMVRKDYMKGFRALDKNTRLQSSLILGSYIAQILIPIAVGTYLLRTPTVLTYFAIGLIVIFIGTRFRGLNNIVHECSHFTFATNRGDNVIMGNIAASMLLNSFENYRKEHLTHHAHLGDYEKDLDIRGIESFHLEDKLTIYTIVRHVLTPLVGYHLPRYFSVNFSLDGGIGYFLQKIVLILGTLVLGYFNPQAALLLVVIPFVWVYSAINYWTDCVDHGGLIGSEDELEASRNLILPKAVRVFLFPRNDCYHLIHHLFPSIPAQHFDKCHKQLLENASYRTAQNTDKSSTSINSTKLLV